ncbi:hypothetical protein BARVI_06035 [Barnesiella viscericola DSM 18177]|uniref:Uncharacterized protein n=1 Tax=Barnesiella viscericola DSM 18177 TaxID=880074 RepID=W0EXG6_9BACT|nr:hypothetical protein BARVI_06035 [Barnesiella viscericola DSM 18177]
MVCSSTVIVFVAWGRTHSPGIGMKPVTDIEPRQTFSFFANVIFFLFFKQNNHKMITDIPVSFTILYFTSDFKRQFELSFCYKID